MLTLHTAASHASTFSSNYSMLNKPLPEISCQQTRHSDAPSLNKYSGTHPARAIELSTEVSEPTHLRYAKMSGMSPNSGTDKRYTAYTRPLTPTAELPADSTWR